MVPVPVARDRWAPADPADAPGDPQAPLRVLHVAGHRAMGDRNGTTEVLMAVARCRQPMVVTLVTQDPRLPSARTIRGDVRVQTILGGVGDYWNLYAGHDVLVLPRRYGGLCLPAQEAMGAGLAVVMTDVEPQRSVWPIIGAPSISRGTLRTGGGEIDLWTAEPHALARILDDLAGDRDRLDAARAGSRAWAAANGWSSLAPTYEAALAG